jgi:zinc transport system permease protein
VSLYNKLISVMAALVIGVSIKIVGGLLVSALLVIPAACSLAVARSFKQSVAIVVVIAECAVIGGLLVAGYWNLAPGATIVLLLIAALLALLGVRKGFKI